MFASTLLSDQVGTNESRRKKNSPISYSAHDGKAKERAADFHKINGGLTLPKSANSKAANTKGSPSKKSGDYGHNFRYLFLFNGTR